MTPENEKFAGDEPDTTEIVSWDETSMMDPSNTVFFKTTSFSKKRHVARTQTGLAYSALGLVAVFTGIPFVMRWAGIVAADEFAGLLTATGGIQTLAATAFGFYFAQTGKK